MIKRLLVVLTLVLSSEAHSALILEENFENVPALTGEGWLFEIRSNPSEASTGWVQGVPEIFEGQSPPPDSYAGSSFSELIAGSFLDDRLFTPELDAEFGLKASFFLRGEDFEEFFDQVSYGFTNGSGTELSNFIVMETTTVPTEMWGLYSIILPPQGAGAVARLGFRHFGLQDTSNVVGLDTLMIETLNPPPSAVPEPASMLIVALGLVGVSLTRCRQLQSTRRGREVRR